MDTAEDASALSFALEYARAGYAVMPVKPAGKLPLTQHGSADATTDEAVIREWWKRWPDANIGITLAGLVVVDIDPRNGGDAANLPFPLPDTCMAKTGGGGEHAMYASRENVRYPKSLGPGIDLKFGGGQYIVAEPSIHASGEKYVWIDESEPWRTRPALAPEWLGRESRNEKRNGNGANGAQGAIREGGRNVALTSMAGAMRRRSFTVDAITAAILVHNSEHCDPPLPDEDVRSIAKSVCRYEPAGDGQPAHATVSERRAPSIGRNWRA